MGSYLISVWPSWPNVVTLLLLLTNLLCRVSSLFCIIVGVLLSLSLSAEEPAQVLLFNYNCGIAWATFFISPETKFLFKLLARKRRKSKGTTTTTTTTTVVAASGITRKQKSFITSSIAAAAAVIAEKTEKTVRECSRKFKNVKM